MKHRHALALTTLAGSLIAVSSAQASYQGLQVTVNQAVADGELRNVYRVYALFSDPDDYLTAVAGSPNLGNITIQSTNADFTGPGGNFFQTPTGTQTAPTAYAITQNPSALFDTFVTIGVGIADQGSGVPPNSPDETGVTPGFAGFGNGNQYDHDNTAWFTPGPVEQGRAGYLGDGDPLLRVLMMQLTVSSTSGVRGTVAVAGVNNNPLAGGQSFQVANQTFQLPAPGALALLGLAGWCGKGRRRR